MILDFTRAWGPPASGILDMSDMGNVKIRRSVFVRVIPLTKHVDIVSDISPGIINGIYSDFLSCIRSGILSGAYSSIFSRIYSDVLSGINSDVLSGMCCRRPYVLPASVLVQCDLEVATGFGQTDLKLAVRFGSARAQTELELAIASKSLCAQTELEFAETGTGYPKARPSRSHQQPSKAILRLMILSGAILHDMEKDEPILIGKKTQNKVSQDKVTPPAMTALTFTLFSAAKPLFSQPVQGVVSRAFCVDLQIDKLLHDVVIVLMILHRWKCAFSVPIC